MLIIYIPNFSSSEIIYSINILINEFLGFEFEIYYHDKSCIIIKCEGDIKHQEFSINASFFQILDKHWLQKCTLPTLPLKYWNPSDDSIPATLSTPCLPVLFGNPGIKKSSRGIHLYLDVFGSAFYMLSRYEEIVTNETDKHGRFPAKSSVAFKASFLDRPIINEYLEVLWECLKILWPDLKRKKQNFTKYITCDVDWPFDPSIYFLKNATKNAIHFLYDRKPLQSLQSFLNYFGNKLYLKKYDKFRENINWIMEVNEQVANRVAFYFIPYKTSSLDTSEDFNSNKIRSIFREIYSRGHEIGIHPGYNTFNNSINFRKSVDELIRIFQEECISQDVLGGRQHFLRWDTSRTPHLWDENNLSYDSSLSYADQSGFRCGVCYEYTMYDLINRKSFKLKQRPLIVMESSIISSRYEGLGYTKESYKRFIYFKKMCKKFNGMFTLLWHNSHFEFSKDKLFYQKLIA